MFETRQESFPSKEERILEFWKLKKIFNKTLEKTRNQPLFSFYDGPPFATGLPHYGHILAGTIKDVIPRYKTMQGFFVPRKFGWDCHGLPIENEIEKGKELSGAPAIEAFGIDKFNEECRSIVLRYTAEWESTVDRMGRWVDFQNSYRTMDPTFMESVWWVFSQIYDKGLVYEGFKVMPFSARLGTPISNFEANLNYRDVDDPSLVVAFASLQDPKISFLAWTTTPWTLPSNLALMVGPDLDYIEVEEVATGAHYVLAEQRLEAIFKESKEMRVVKRMKGSELVGQMYAPLFSYFSDARSRGAFRIIAEETVSVDEGTGIVHSAPAFGEVDFFACERAGIPLVCPIDQNGKFTQEVPDFFGLFVKDADKEIIRRLKAEKKVLQHGQIRHRYPFCWRSDTPLIYKAVRTWFVSVEKIKERMIEINQTINWVPHNIRDGRFGKWLENARDWAISRNRYWGTPIPIWRSDEGDCIVISSVADLEKRTGKKVTDLHRHHIDALTFTENGKVYKRIPEVFDCWFDAGSMPYAQKHYPFENQEETMRSFPADFIAEGLDQTRGWFYTLTILSTALFDQPAFKQVIVNGIILAEDGTKMSKRLKNYPEPGKVFNEYGADAVRMYLLNSPVVAAEDLRFSEKGVEGVLRQLLLPLWNSYSFLATYAKIYAWDPETVDKKAPEALIDRWILSLLEGVVQKVTDGMDRYELQSAVSPLIGFVDQLTNWYIRRSRSRFWADEKSQDRDEAFATLYRVLIRFAQVAAPFIPFITEEIFHNLRTDQAPVSVHLCDYPLYDEALRDFALEEEMRFVQTAVTTGHALRKEHQLKVRQPLKEAFVICANSEILESLRRQAHLIGDELNVKEITCMGDESQFVTLHVKPNFRVLGKKVGKKMVAVQKEIEQMSQKLLEQLLSGNSVTLLVEGEEIVVTPEDVTVERKAVSGRVAATSDGITIALDIELTPELIQEGFAREIINKVNTMRRELGFAVTDRIAIKMQATDPVRAAFEAFYALICHEVLAEDVVFGPCAGVSVDLNGEEAVIQVSSL